MNKMHKQLWQGCLYLCAAVLMTACVNALPSSPADAPAASGPLTVLEWAGYDEPQYYQPFAANHPDGDIEFAYLDQDSDAYAKMQSGFQIDVVHPCSNWWGVWVQAGLVQPIDTTRLSNWSGISPKLAALGNFDGQQYFVPWEWGFDSILVRTDKIEKMPESWGDLWDPAYAGRLSIADMPEVNHATAALALGIKDPWQTTPEQNEAIKQKLIELKPNVLTYWTGSTELSQLVASGDVWIASNVWPDTYGTLLDEGVQVEYLEPKEGRLGWVCGYGISANAEHTDLAYEYLDALISPESMAQEANDFWYGAANMDALPLIDESVVKLFELDDPTVLDRTIFYETMSEEQRAEVTEMWDEVKASQ